MSRKAKILTFACLFAIMFAVQLIGTSFHFHHLMFREVGSTLATVFSTTPESHAAVYYRYAIDSRTFEGVGSSMLYKPGDRVRIFYAIDEPEDSELQENIPSAKDMIAFTFMASLFASFLGTALISMGMSSRRNATRLPKD